MGSTVYRVAPQLEWRAGEHHLTLNDVRARVENESGSVDSLVLLAELSAEDAKRAQQGHWMHLIPERCGPQAGGAWRDSAPVHLEARPATDLLTAASLLSEDVWDVLAEVRFARVLTALHEADSWFVLRLTQADAHVPGVQLGLRTTWVGEPRL
jgi:hypothetical protein